MADVEVLDMFFNSAHGILDQSSDFKQSDSTSNMLFSTTDDQFQTGSVLSWPSPITVDEDLTNCPDDFLNSLLDSNLDDDTKKQQMKLSDHDYSVAMPTSPHQSDSGLSSGPYSPYSNTSVEDLVPLELEKELFGPLDLKNYAMEDNMDLGFIDPSLIESLPNASLISEKSLSEDSTDSTSFNFDFEKLFHGSDAPTVATSVDGATKVIKVVSLDTRPNQQSLLPFTVNQVNKDTTNGQNYPELRLSDEEKELLEREGYSIPTNMPLTRDEEKMLRSVRRRIRNKASARNSRRKKQDYMEQLEQRVKMCSDEKRKLEKKITHLEKQNSSLIGQLKRLQQLVTEGTKQTTRAGTCAMVLALSFALVVLPNFSFSFNGTSDSQTALRSTPMAGRSRSLLNILPTKEDVSTNYLPFFNLDKMRSYIPGGSGMHDEPVDGEEPRYMVDEPVEGDGDYTLVKDNFNKIKPEVIHMEITKISDTIPTVKTPAENFTGEEHHIVVNKRSIRMDVEDHDEL